MIDYPVFIETLQSAVEKLRPLCRRKPTLEIKAPSTPNDVRKTETEIGRSIPAELRDFFLKCSSDVRFYWTIDDERHADDLGLAEVQFGACDLRLAMVSIDYSNWTGWEDCFEHPEYYSGGTPRYQFNALFPVFSTVNGDVIAQVVTGPDTGHLIYLDHEGGDFDQTILAHSLDEFLSKWSLLGCPGPEHCCLKPFFGPTTPDVQRIENATRWCSWAGLKTT